jgi:hypothetical protein
MKRSRPIGTTTTGQVARWTTLWLTDPSNRPAKPPWPRDPTTSRLASWVAPSSTAAVPAGTTSGSTGTTRQNVSALAIADSSTARPTRSFSFVS